MKKEFLTIGFIFLGCAVYSQFEISAEIRPRAEYRMGYRELPGPGDYPAALISQRTRLNVGFAGGKLKAFVSFLDARVWGDEQLFSSTGVFGDNSSIDLKEGWIEMDASKGHAIRIGRQYLVYDDERLFATRNWNQNSVTYDAFLYKFQKEKWNLHTGLSLNNTADNLFGSDYNLYREVLVFDTATQTIITKKVTLSSRIQSMNFIYVSRSFGKSFVSLILLGTGMQNSKSANDVYLKGTSGIFYKYEAGNLFGRASAYYQFGSNAASMKVDAYMFTGYVKYTIAKYLFNAGVDYISGQDATSENANYQGKDHFFDIFYGVRHRYYGLMDYFNNMRTATAGGGLTDLYAGIGFIPVPKLSIQLDYHYFALQNRVTDPENPANALEKALGSEVDLSTGYKILPEVKIEGGFSVMLPTASMQAIQKINTGEGKLAYWGWVMLTAKPTLFRSDK